MPMLPKPVIDFHTHIGRLYCSFPRFTVRNLLGRMDELGISMAVVLPIENPEETDFYVITESILRAVKRHHDRLIPFCNVDPRRGEPQTFNPRPIIEKYISRGCRGFGEELAGLMVDDPRLQRIYQAVADFGIPLVMHFDAHRNIDEIGFPRFERMIEKYSKTIFVGHGPHWWAEISGDVRVEDIGRYPTGSVSPGGKVERLLQRYGNLYADLSADSGLNALARDPEFGRDFLERNCAKLLFGTDLLYEAQEVKIVKFLEDVNLSERAYRDILYRNAERLLKLEVAS